MDAYLVGCDNSLHVVQEIGLHEPGECGDRALSIPQFGDQEERQESLVGGYWLACRRRGEGGRWGDPDGLVPLETELPRLLAQGILLQHDSKQLEDVGEELCGRKTNKQINNGPLDQSTTADELIRANQFSLEPLSPQATLQNDDPSNCNRTSRRGSWWYPV